MTAVSFTIPGDARGKGRPVARRRNLKGGGQYVAVMTDDKTSAYENLVKLAAERAMSGRPPLGVPVALEIRVRVTPPKSASRKSRAAMLSGALRPAKKPDLTNIVKAVEDGANKVAYTDDAMIVSIVAVKFYAETSGVDVSIAPVWDADQSERAAA